MYPFLETICIRNGTIQLPTLHQERMQNTLAHYGSSVIMPFLCDLVELPMNMKHQTVKWRLLYNETGKYRSEFTVYSPRVHKSIALVELPNVHYPFKLSNRNEFSEILNTHSRYDDVIIVQNGYLTDTTYANIVLFLHNQWLTPERPLLAGVQRRHLIETGKITPAPLQVKDIFRATQILYINAMLPLDQSPHYPPSIFTVIV